MRNTDLKVLNLFLRLIPDYELMSTGIVSSKEGHDESHIDETKLRKKLWNVVANVTIGLTQKVLTQRLF